jgi:hypothetical protein
MNNNRLMTKPMAVLAVAVGIGAIVLGIQHGDWVTGIAGAIVIGLVLNIWRMEHRQ